MAMNEHDLRAALVEFFRAYPDDPSAALEHLREMAPRAARAVALEIAQAGIGQEADQARAGEWVNMSDRIEEALVKAHAEQLAYKGE